MKMEKIVSSVKVLEKYDVKILEDTGLYFVVTYLKEEELSCSPRFFSLEEAEYARDMEVNFLHRMENNSNRGIGKVKLSQPQIEFYLEEIEQAQSKINDCIEALKNNELDEIQRKFLNSIINA